MNAVSKVVSPGIYDKKRKNDLKAVHAEVKALPYADILGRRIRLFCIVSGAWRAFNGCSTPRHHHVLALFAKDTQCSQAPQIGPSHGNACNLPDGLSCFIRPDNPFPFHCRAPQGMHSSTSSQNHSPRCDNT
jgi:hypothetical protein